MKKIYLFSLLLLCVPVISSAQKVSVSTNLVDWANLLTYNGEVGVAITRHVSVVAGGRYNNLQKTGDDHIITQNRQKTFYAGARYWFWYANTGAWAGAKAQYQEQAQSGLWRLALNESKNVGLALSGGYAILIGKHFNIDFGLGFWAGRRLEYTLYDCPVCLNVRDQGPRFFILPDNIYITIAFVI